MPMLSLFQKVEKNFTIFFTISLFVGVAAPGLADYFGKNYVMGALVLVLFLSFLKIEFGDIIANTKRPVLLAYAFSLQAIAIPLFCFAATLPLERDLQLGLVLTAALPTGVSATAITGMIRGKASLTLIICVITSLLAPLTIPALFYILFSSSVKLDYSGLILTLSLMIAVPLTAAHLIKRTCPKRIEQFSPYTGGISVGLLSLIIAAVIAKEALFIRSNANDVIRILVYLFVLFIVIQITCYFAAIRVSNEERRALSVSKSVMNPALGIFISIQLFPDKPIVALVLILAEVPWATVPTLYRLYPEPQQKPKSA